MTTGMIDGHDIRNWFRSGLQELDRHRAQIDAINVFPVPDGDTGTNLSMTLRAMAEGPPFTASFGGMIAGISESGLAHAHGNSGLIFASYISGIAQEGRGFDRVDLSQFAALAHRAVDYIGRAISEPVEGTMVTVIRDWAAFLSSNHSRFDSFEGLLAAAYETARISLSKTTEKLEILKKYHVVDAGAAGFVRFLQGINSLFSAGYQIEEEDEAAPGDLLETTDEEISGRRYCVEMLVASRPSDQETIREALAPLGDSLILSQGGARLRIHIHTDQPEEVRAVLGSYGTVLEQNVDDMAIRIRMVRHRASDIAILTDSIADLPDEVIQELQIHQIPLTLLIDGEAYLDKQTIGLKRLFEAIPRASAYPMSSQPEPARVADTLDMLTEHYRSVIAISVSDKLSGTCGVFRSEAIKAAERGGDVTVVDSRLNSGAQGIIVKKAAEMACAGADRGTILKSIEEMIPKTKIYVCLETIENAVRGGRVPNSIGRFGMAIGARPIMTLAADGKGAVFGVGFSKQGMTRKIFKLARRIQGEKGIRAYSVVHSNNPELAAEYAAFMKDLTGFEPEFVTEISSVVAIHSGSGVVALSIVEK